ncbi:LysR family transcriptional regulator [Ferrimonas aestuarii]|uniref:LysR family transcriptional regulator n=1 Tax=Ferrimonas aestuarii TaxID=2569539 RepID=A0A4U1BQ41_9GAMM|nr:LysR family transcriptional regulator [Ferrimonas aestuarii]TKB54665.1 LysR family transcriptional regulator [Ferrimonas aestuarii]
MRITLKQLLVFKTVCETQQISKAARQLHLSVSAVSMSLKELESSLDAQLVERTPSGLVVNQSGQRVLQHANSILSQVQHLETQFQEQAAGLGGSLVIGANKTAGNYVLSRRLPHFKRMNPNVQTRLKILSSVAIEKMLINNELDLAFIGHPPKDKGLHYIRWRSDRLCVVASPGHKLAHRPASAADLSAATWVLDEEDSATRIESLHLLKALGVSVHDEIIMNTMGAIKRAVGTGLGLSVLPLLSVDAELERGELREVATGSEAQSRYIYVIFKPERRNALIENFLNSCDVPLDD